MSSSQTSTQGLTRRQFIRITAAAGVMLAGGAGIAALKANAQTTSVKETRLLLGSIANMTLVSDDPDYARQAINATFDRMEALEAVFSRFQQNSQLSQLNAHGHLADADPALREVLARAVAYGDLTEGAFDVTVEPVHRAYRDGLAQGQLPNMETVAAARQLVDYRQISMTGSTVQLGKTGMAITLDGIAKGYIVDVGVAVLQEFGFENVLVELGGDLRTLGTSINRPWRISVREPDAQQPQRIVVPLSGAAMATSGDYLNAFTSDHSLHHILDPHSGISPGELASASVIAPTVCDADALSTAMMVMGSRRGLALIERLPGMEALVIAKDGTMQQTAGFMIA